MYVTGKLKETTKNAATQKKKRSPTAGQLNGILEMHKPYANPFQSIFHPSPLRCE